MSVIKKNIVSNTILSASQILFPLITFPYASRILGPKGVGQISFVESISQYFILFAAVGIPLYGVRELAKLRHNQKESNIFFSEIIVLHLLTTLISLIIYFIIIFFLRSDTDSTLFVIGGGMILVNVFIVEWYYQSQEKFSYIAKRTIVLRVIFIVAMFLFVKTKEHLLIYYFLFFALQLCNACLNFFLVFYSGLKFKFKNLNLSKHIRPLLFLTACSVIGSVYVLLDNVLLGILGDSVSLGYYSSAMKVTKVPISLISALAIVLVPKMSDSFARNDFKAISYYINTSIHYVVTLAIPLAIGIALTAKWSILLISGSEFLPSIRLVQILSPIVLLIALNSVFFFQLFTPGNKERIMIVVLLTGAAISISVNLMLIPVLKQEGAAIATTLTELTVFVLSLYFAKRTFNIGISPKLIFAPIVSSLLFFPIIYLIDLLDYGYIYKFFFGALMCVICYFAIQLFVFKDLIVRRSMEYIQTILMK